MDPKEALQRRQVLRAAGFSGVAVGAGFALRGVGGTPPAPRGYRSPDMPGTAPGPSAGVLLGRRLIIAGPVGQVLVYDTSPASAGHLIASVLGAGFTDTFGNLGLIGSTAYGHIFTPSTHYIAVQQTTNGIYLSTSTTEAGPWTQIARLIYTEPPSHSTGNTGLLLSNDVSAAQLLLGDVNDAAGRGRIIAVNSFTHVNDPNAVAAVETWHNISAFLNGWLAGSVQPRYQMKPDGTVQMDGTIDGHLATAATFMTMDPKYRPDPTTIPTRIWPAGANVGVPAGASPFITINGSTGSIATGGVTPGTAGLSVTISGFYAMD